MKGRLTERDMEMLEQWMCIGPKSFSLLYAIKRDGCNATTFHEKCDNQGPTVTVLYNLEGSVYGGYTSARWNGCGHYITTNDSFLFQLHYVHRPKANKFPLKPGGYEYSIYGDSRYGPTFGGGYDLATFHGTINEEDGYFALNGYLHVGMSYDNMGIANDKINNGNMNVFELEVYRVDDCQRLEAVNPDDSKPWRKTEVWNDELFNTLKKEIVAYKPREDVNVKEARLLLIGPIGSGKSSFYNTVNSAFCGRISRPALAGSSEQSLTTIYKPYTVEVQSGDSLNFRFCDTPGIEVLEGISEVECNYLLDGNVPDYYQIDKLCKEVENDVSFVFKSPKVEKCVKKAANLLGLPESNVLPVKNYDNEFEPEENINILALLSVRQILNFTEDFFKHFSC